MADENQELYWKGRSRMAMERMGMKIFHPPTDEELPPLGPPHVPELPPELPPNVRKCAVGQIKLDVILPCNTCGLRVPEWTCIPVTTYYYAKGPEDEREREEHNVKCFKCSSEIIIPRNEDVSGHYYCHARYSGGSVRRWQERSPMAMKRMRKIFKLPAALLPPGRPDVPELPTGLPPKVYKCAVGQIKLNVLLTCNTCGLRVPQSTCIPVSTYYYTKGPGGDIEIEHHLNCFKCSAEITIQHNQDVSHEYYENARYSDGSIRRERARMEAAWMKRYRVPYGEDVSD